MTKFGDHRSIPQAKMFDFTDEKIAEMRAEAVQLFDELSGNKTTDLKTFEAAIFVARKN